MRRLYQIGLPSILLLLAVLAGCVDGQFSLIAPDDLDITPSPTNTLVPTATPSPTPLPEDFIDPALANERALETIVAAIPARIAAGAVEWRRDLSGGLSRTGLDVVPRAINGAGAKIYFNEQTGGQMNLTFAVFNTPEDAAAHYEFIRGIRQPLEIGEPDESMPLPNIFGSGTYGSLAIFQIDNVFIEVNIELFSSTQGNPLVPLARATIRFFEEVQPQLEASNAEEVVAEVEESVTGNALLDAFLETMPEQIMGDAIWTRDMTRSDGLEFPSNFGEGDVIRVFYGEQTGGAMQWTIGVFATAEDALAQYERFKGIREGLDDENTNEDFPQPHIFGQGLYGSVALFQLDTIFIEVLIERAPGTIANPLNSISRTVLDTLETAQASVND
ncbi:MAG: hypothetical protein Q9P01_03480 [Anaerolineae bacterium]|nr:hypothetical protein [Anaerolineae bacterium]